MSNFMQTFKVKSFCTFQGNLAGQPTKSQLLQQAETNNSVRESIG
jgi:hypothetical protein